MVFQDDRANLFYLVRLCVRAILLKIDHLFDAGAFEDVMATSSGPFLEPEMQKQLAQIIEPDVCVCCAAQHLLERLLCPRHVFSTLPCRP